MITVCGGFTPIIRDIEDATELTSLLISSEVVVDSRPSAPDDDASTASSVSSTTCGGWEDDVEVEYCFFSWCSEILCSFVEDVEEAATVCEAGGDVAVVEDTGNLSEGAKDGCPCVWWL